MEDPVARARIQQQTETLARWLDSGLRLPGTSIRFGLDALIGLIPGIGDAIGALLGGFLLLQAHRAGAPAGLLARMVGNLALDGVLGLLPGLGDLADVAFRAHARNARLLQAHLAASQGPVAAGPAGRGVFLLLGLAALLLLSLPLVLLWWIFRLF